MYTYIHIYIYIYILTYLRIYIPYLPKPLSHLLVSMKITTQTCSKMKCADEDFPEFHP